MSCIPVANFPVNATTPTCMFPTMEGGCDTYHDKLVKDPSPQFFSEMKRDTMGVAWNSGEM